MVKPHHETRMFALVLVLAFVAVTLIVASVEYIVRAN